MEDWERQYKEYDRYIGILEIRRNYAGKELVKALDAAEKCNLYAAMRHLENIQDEVKLLPIPPTRSEVSDPAPFNAAHWQAKKDILNTYQEGKLKIVKTLNERCGCKLME
ncbi:MAG: hypothetical protein PHZ19_03660 [Candidatus Thermoplasmatota archaeon]|nr:hypothetical protein [Candidatus Thermoplasmatota archaeon]